MNENRLLQLRQMRDADPSDPFLPYAIAQEYLGSQFYTEARAELDGLLLSHPSYLPAYHQLALACIGMNDVEAAVARLKEGIALGGTQGNRKAVAEMREILEELED